MDNIISLKKTLLIATASTLAIAFPSFAGATSCPANISGAMLAEEICDFNSGENISVANDGQLGGILVDNYNPAENSFILNNGRIANNLGAVAIDIIRGSLSNGITNNGNISSENSAIAISFETTISNQINNTGTISGTDGNAIFIYDNNTINGDINNSGSLISQNEAALHINQENNINGNIVNSGNIISNSVNNPAILIRNGNTITGNIVNSGTIRAFGDGSAMHIDDGGVIEGSINNSSTIRAGYFGIYLAEATIEGSINNSGTITSDSQNGLHFTNASTINGDIENSGAISGGTNGILVNNSSTIQNISNQAGASISGDESGIFIESSTVANIENYGTITGDTYAIFISDDSTVNGINIFEGSIINGAIDANSTNLNISGGTINGTIRANSVNINSGATFAMTHEINAQNGLNNAGTLIIGSDTKTIGSYTQLTGGTLQISVVSATDYGQLIANDAVNLSQSGAIDVDVDANANIMRGDVLTNVISSSSLGSPTGGFTISDNSRLLNFSAATNGFNGVNITAIDDDTTSITQSNFTHGSSANAGAAMKLDEIFATNSTGDWRNIINAFNQMNSDEEISDAVNQTTPALKGATNSAIIETINTAINIVQARLEANSGISSGEDFKTNRNIWIKPFGSWGEQGNKNGVVGYDSKARGIIAGIDKATSENATLGFGFSYFNSQLKSNDANNRIDVDSALGIVYGNYNIDYKTQINAQGLLGYNRSDSTRHINFGNLNRTAQGSYHGWNMHAGAGLSRLINLSNATTIIPQIRADYFLVGNRAYEETGAGALNLHVGAQRQAQLIPAFEVKANHNFTQQFSFALNAGIGYDLLTQQNTVSSSFENGGEFVSRGLKPSPWILRSGAGINWKQSDDLDFTARYDRRDRGSEYVNQTLSLNVKMMY